MSGRKLISTSGQKLISTSGQFRPKVEMYFDVRSRFEHQVEFCY